VTVAACDDQWYDWSSQLTTGAVKRFTQLTMQTVAQKVCGKTRNAKVQ